MYIHTCLTETLYKIDCLYSVPVNRYTGGGKDDRRGAMTVHTLQKKYRRFQQQLVQLTGLRTKVQYMCRFMENGEDLFVSCIESL